MQIYYTVDKSADSKSVGITLYEFDRNKITKLLRIKNKKLRRC